MNAEKNDGVAEMLAPFLKPIQQRKAMDVIVLDMSTLTSVADAFIICSGRSNRQVTAIAEHVKIELKKTGCQPLSAEGIREGQWVLLDYGHVVIHVFYDPVRRFYDIEGLWTDAPRIPAGETVLDSFEKSPGDELDE